MVSTVRMQEFGWCCIAMGHGAASSACSSASHGHAGNQVGPSGCMQVVSLLSSWERKRPAAPSTRGTDTNLPCNANDLLCRTKHHTGQNPPLGAASAILAVQFVSGAEAGERHSTAMTVVCLTF